MAHVVSSDLAAAPTDFSWLQLRHVTYIDAKGNRRKWEVAERSHRVGHQARISTRLLVIHHDRREIIGAEKLNSLSLSLSLPVSFPISPSFLVLKPLSVSLDGASEQGRR